MAVAPQRRKYASLRDPSPAGARSLRVARALATWLDEAIAIPGTSLRIGLDPLLGLVPGLGDALGLLASAYVVVVALRLGAPGSVAARMVVNLLVDAAVGAIPVLGDLFDFGWKANTRNLALLEKWMERPGTTRRASRALVAALVAAVIAVAAAVGFATWRVVAWAAGRVAR
jgi:hypothetical protein